MRYLASRTNFSDSLLAGMVTGFIKVFTFGCSYLLTGDMVSYCSRMSSNLLALSCKWIGTLLAFCFLKTASRFKGRSSGEFTFPTTKLDVAQFVGYLNSKEANFSNSLCVI